jgi:predicted nucleic acid-binding protein
MRYAPSAIAVIVIDASALLELLLQTDKAEQIGATALAPDERLHAPHLLDVEVTQALRRLVQLKQVTASRATQVLEDYGQLAIERHVHLPFLERIWQLRDAVTAYDGMYVALAEALDAPLMTCDAKLARAQGHGATVVLV